MLQFVFGVPGSGKTHWIMERLKQTAQKGGRAVLLIPEQFSFESERSVLRALGDKAARNVTVMSFTRLCDEVGREAGGIAGITLSGADKVIFMSRALLAAANELTLWGKYSRSVSFAKTMLDTIGEFKINAISTKQLRDALEKAESPALKNKLHDILLIYEHYDALLGEKFIDPADRLTKLYRQLETHRFFEGKEVYLDSFKSFTGQQYRIIDRIFAQADQMTVALTNDPAIHREYDIFSNIRKTVERIRSSAKRYAVEESDPVALGNAYLKNETIKEVGRLIAGIDDPAEKKDPASLSIIKAKTIYDEAEFAARTVRKLVREEGYRYRDFVLIARNAEQYVEAIGLFCRQNDIPLFSDKRLPLSSFPLSVATLYAVKTAISFTTENLFGFLKTGLSSLTQEEISRLENYATLWNIEGQLWKQKWTMDPRGFLSSQSEPDEEELLALNELRIKASEPLLRFASECSGRASDMVAALVRLFESLEVSDKLSRLAEEYAADQAEIGFDELRASYQTLMCLFDSIARCYGERTLTTREFSEALKLSVASETVGVIPRMLDEVTFGAADRIRPSRPKIAFLLGANRGIFPKTAVATGLFRGKERTQLLSMGIEMPDHILEDATDEEFLVYCTASCPSDKLYISYAETAAKGEALEPSAFVTLLSHSFGLKEIPVPQEELTSQNLPETFAAAYSEYCRRYRQGDTEELSEALKNSREFSKAQYLQEVLSDREKSLSPATAKALYGNKIAMSASKFDTFRRCSFSYFCKYGLVAKRIQPAEFDVLQRGTIVHYVLEKLISTYKKEIANFEPEKIGRLVREYINEYLDSVSGYRETETDRFRFLVTRISRLVEEVACHIALEFAQTDFEPVACELKIGRDGAVLPVLFPFETGTVVLTGSIDRVDDYNGYLRVIDYKTGKREFKLPDTLFGLNLQMLLYLYAITRGNGLPDEKAAGILYLRARRDLDQSGMAMNGLLQNDTALVSAMDKEMQGKFVPKYELTNAGELKKTCKSFISKENFSDLFDYIEHLMRDTGKRLLQGDIRVNPLDGRDSAACEYCDYHAICGMEDEEIPKVPSLKNEEVFEQMQGGKPDGV